MCATFGNSSVLTDTKDAFGSCSSQILYTWNTTAEELEVCCHWHQGLMRDVRTFCRRIWRCNRLRSWARGCPDPDTPASRQIRSRSETQGGTRRVKTNADGAADCVRIRNKTHIVKSSELMHQPVEFEKIQIPVAQHGSLIDGSSWGEKWRS